MKWNGRIDASEPAWIITPYEERDGAYVPVFQHGAVVHEMRTTEEEAEERAEQLATHYAVVGVRRQGERSAIRQLEGLDEKTHRDR